MLKNSPAQRQYSDTQRDKTTPHSAMKIVYEKSYVDSNAAATHHLRPKNSTSAFNPNLETESVNSKN